MNEDGRKLSLSRFYTCATNKNGEEYSKSSLISFRKAIERYLNNKPFMKKFEPNSAAYTNSNRKLNSTISYFFPSSSQLIKCSDVLLSALQVAKLSAEESPQHFQLSVRFIPEKCQLQYNWLKLTSVQQPLQSHATKCSAAACSAAVISTRSLFK